MATMKKAVEILKAKKNAHAGLHEVKADSVVEAAQDRLRVLEPVQARAVALVERVATAEVLVAATILAEAEENHRSRENGNVFRSKFT